MCTVMICFEGYKRNVKKKKKNTPKKPHMLDLAFNQDEEKVICNNNVSQHLFIHLIYIF